MARRRDPSDRADQEGSSAGAATAAVGGTLRRGLKSALARWVIQKRRARGALADTPGPSTHDEATHPWDGRRRFAEDYTFCAVQAGTAVLVRIEWLPGRASTRVWVLLLREDGVYTVPRGQQLLRGGDDRWRAGGLEIDCVAPHQRWTIRYAGQLTKLAPGRVDGDPPPDDGGKRRCSLDLTFLARADPYVPGGDDDPELIAQNLGAAQWDVDLLRSVRRVSGRGYVQLGEMHGSMALGDELIALRSGCLRQHTWGVRDWGASDAAFQCFVVGDDESRAWVHSARFPQVTLEGGFVRANGATLPVRSIGVTREKRPDRAPARASLSLEHARGNMAIEAETISDIVFDVDGRGTVALALLRLSGPCSGWGFWGGQWRSLPRWSGPRP